MNHRTIAVPFAAPASLAEALLSVGYVHEHIPAEWEDVGDAENGPRLSGHEEADVYTLDCRGAVHEVVVCDGQVVQVEFQPPTPPGWEDQPEPSEESMTEHWRAGGFVEAAPVDHQQMIRLAGVAPGTLRGVALREPVVGRTYRGMMNAAGATPVPGAFLRYCGRGFWSSSSDADVSPADFSYLQEFLQDPEQQT